MSYWLKLYTEILDDAKVAKLSDFQFRVFMLCLLYAKELDKGGDLAPAADVAWRFRLPEKAVVDALLAMKGVGIIAEKDGRYSVVNFAKRQAVSTSAERVRKFRERKREKLAEDVTHVTVTPSSSSSVSSSPLLLSESDSQKWMDV